VVFVFHGLGQSAEQIRDYSFFNNIADTAGFVVVYPQGFNNGWNVGFALGNPTTTDDVDFTEKIIQFLYHNSNLCAGGVCEGIDTNSIFSCGMSNGGFFSYHLACNLSNRMAAIASVTGSMTENTLNQCNPTKPVPVLEIHGDADLVVPYTGSALSGAKSIPHVLNYWRDHNGCPANPTSQPLPDLVSTDNSTVTAYYYAPCNQGSMILHYKVWEGGHCWPGSAVAPGLGNTNMDIDASKEIWKFFKQYVTSQPSAIHDKKQTSLILLHYNPVDDYIKISFRRTDIHKQIQLFNLSGKLLVNQTINRNEKEFYYYTEHLENGLYLLRYSDEISSGVYRVLINH
jgi:polyhydroxybutyrate depolymerase